MGYTLKKLEKYTDEQQLLDAVADVDAVIIRSDIASAKVMDAGKNLKLIVRAGAGYDNIDLPAASQRSIITMNTPGANVNPADPARPCRAGPSPGTPNPARPNAA